LLHQDVKGLVRNEIFNDLILLGKKVDLALQFKLSNVFKIKLETGLEVKRKTLKKFLDLQLKDFDACGELYEILP
jgi:hypothetical protein